MLRYTSRVLFNRRPANAAPAALVFGLGNPGPRYSATRHNAGWWALDALTHEHKVIRRDSRHHGHAEFITLPGVDGLLNVALIRPNTFMNLSGNCVRQWRQAYRDARLVVVYDDIALPVGKLRIRDKGSAGGHNGVKSIIAALGGEEFWRLKIGVGAPEAGEDGAEYVLQAPTQSEREAIFKVLPLAARLLEQLALGDYEGAQRQLAQYEQSLKPRQEPAAAEEPAAEAEPPTAP